MCTCTMNWLTPSSDPLCNVISKCPQFRLPETLYQVTICTCMFRTISQPFLEDGSCDILSSLMNVITHDEVNLLSIIIL